MCDQKVEQKVTESIALPRFQVVCHLSCPVDNLTYHTHPMLYCTVTTSGVSIATRLIQNACCYDGSLCADLCLTVRMCNCATQSSTQGAAVGCHSTLSRHTYAHNEEAE